MQCFPHIPASAIITAQQAIKQVSQIPSATITSAQMVSRFFNADIGKTISTTSQAIQSLQYFQNWFNSPVAQNLKNYLKECNITDTASEYGWCICDKNLRSKIETASSLTQEEFDNLIVDYYSQNKYERIKDKISYWKDVPFLEKRMPIITSCLYVPETMDENNLYNMAIPTLLAQEDGIFDDIIDLIPENIKAIICKQNGLNRNQKRNVVARLLYRLGYKQLSIFAQKVLIERTFRDGRNSKGIPSFSKKEIKKYNKFRNKILHGDKNYLNYGTSKCYIQSWLELELMFNIYAVVIRGLK